MLFFGGSCKMLERVCNEDKYWKKLFEYNFSKEIFVYKSQNNLTNANSWKLIYQWHQKQIQFVRNSKSTSQKQQEIKELIRVIDLNHLKGKKLKFKVTATGDGATGENELLDMNSLV